MDLVWRLHRHGWRVRYEPGVVASHPNRPTFTAWVRQRLTYGRSAAALARRHGAAMAPLRVPGWSALGWSAALLGHPLIAVGIGTATTAALTRKLRGLDHPLRPLARSAGVAR